MHVNGEGEGEGFTVHLIQKKTLNQNLTPFLLAFLNSYDENILRISLFSRYIFSLLADSLLFGLGVKILTSL